MVILIIIKIFVILFNLFVAFLNFRVYEETRALRDIWAVVAWLGAAAGWLAGLYFDVASITIG